MNKGTEYGISIAEKMLELQQAYYGELNTHNDIYADLVSDGGTQDSAAAQMAEDEDFIREYLSDQLMELGKAVLKSAWHGAYCAGAVRAAKSYEEYREKEREQTDAYFHDVNKTLRSFEAFMDEHKNGII